MKEDHFEVLLEDITSKMAALAEGISALPTRSEIDQLREQVRALQDNSEIIKATTTSTRDEVQQLRREVQDGFTAAGDAVNTTHARLDRGEVRLEQHDTQIDQLRRQAV